MFFSTVHPASTEELRDRIHQIEGSSRRTAEARGVPTGFEALDQILGAGGFKRGTLIEWLGGSEGDGTATLALAVAAHIVRQNGEFVAIDGEREFYPVAAVPMGIPLDRTVVVRPETSMAALWAWEQSLRCPGVAVTFGWIDSIDNRLLRRLQLAVETGGGLGFILRHPNGRASPNWATTRIDVKPVPRLAAMRGDDSLGWRWQLRLARGQRGSRETAIEVELADEARDVHLVSELADPEEVGRFAVGSMPGDRITFADERG